jgi:hypothetical protein
MYHDPRSPIAYAPPLPPLDYYALGEGELLANAELRIINGANPGDVDADLNLTVELLMAHLRFASPQSEQARLRYVGNRPASYGSYLVQYETKYPNATDIESRIRASGWRPDPGVSAPFGALRWYHRASQGANPMLAELYKPILSELLLK